MELAIFKNSCPNCGKEISDERLKYGFPCKECLSLSMEELLKQINPKSVNAPFKIYRLLKQNYTLKNYAKYVRLLKEVKKLRKIFKKATGSDLWNAQISWAKRALSEKSFAILAPTGMGKTVFGIFLCIYYALRNRKCYFILPTSLLANQVAQKFLQYLEKIDLGIKVAYYHALLKNKEKKQMLEDIQKGNFDILITTSMFLSKRFELLQDKRFDLIIVDDVDSFLKASKNVDKVLMLLGFTQEIIEKTFELIDLRRELLKNLRFPTLTQDEVVEKQKRIEKLEKEIEKEVKKIKKGILIVSGASTRARRKRVMLFRELLGFEIGTRIEGMRNIEDIYKKPEKAIEEEVFDLIKKFGSGALVFVPMDKGSEYAEYLEQYLTEKGLKVKAYTKSSLKIIEQFVNGEIDVLIGVASYRSPLARGIDLPERIRYAIFAGVPKFKIRINIEEFKPGRLIMLLVYIRDFFEKEEKDLIDSFIAKLRKITGLSEENREAIIEAIKNKQKLEGFLGYCQELFEKISEFLKNALERKEIVQKIKESKKLSFGEEENELVFVIPDVSAYTQASGRTSRMYAGGITKGASIILIDDEKAFNGLLDKIRWWIEDIEFKEFSSVNLENVFKKIDEDRQKILELKSGKIIKRKRKELVKIALMVVESPTKARTIARFFGRPSIREINGVRFYETSTGKYLLIITASAGHVFDLVTQEGFYGVLVKEKNFIPIYGSIKKCPKCLEQFTDDLERCPFDNEELIDKKQILDAIREVAKEVDEILIATDPDTEGEKIGWDIALYLRPFNPIIKRLEFHEITRKAILNALENPREINENLIKAQIVRRIEDRWLGFELSQKVQQKFKRKTLSAGRVQTPVLGWIIQRTLEMRKSIVNFFEVEIENKEKIIFEKEKVENVKEFVENLKKQKLIVKKIEEKEEELNPLPPYTTDTMLRDASSLLKLSASETMQLAQNLFELGLITYLRTDSIRVSSTGINVAKQYISETFGEKLFKPRVWGTEEEGAHECIRPTKPFDVERLIELIRLGVLQLPIRLTRNHFRLYDLIFRRFIASQMKPAKVKKAIFKFKIGELEKEEERIVQIMEEGFIKISPLKISEIKEGELKVINVRHWKAPKLPLYTQADLIALMKEKGIGRPSTYAKIISTLFERRYIRQNARGKVWFTKFGLVVYNYLKEKFDEYINEEVTRELQKIMDKIENGEIDYRDVLSKLYNEIMEIRQIA